MGFSPQIPPVGNTASSTKNIEEPGAPHTPEAVQCPDLHPLPLLLVLLFPIPLGGGAERAVLDKCFAEQLAASLAPLCDGAAGTPKPDGKKTTALGSPSSNSKPQRMTLLILEPRRSLCGQVEEEAVLQHRYHTHGFGGQTFSEPVTQRPRCRSTWVPGFPSAAERSPCPLGQENLIATLVPQPLSNRSPTGSALITWHLEGGTGRRPKLVFSLE